jgi:hypothetical protein
LEFIWNPPGIHLESTYSFGWAVSQKIVCMDSIWTPSLHKEMGGVQMEYVAEGKDLPEQLIGQL